MYNAKALDEKQSLIEANISMKGQEIKELRISMGYTQEEFAHLLGVTLCTVNRWENNKSLPSRLAIIQLEKILG